MTDSQLLLGIIENDEQAWRHIYHNMRIGFASILRKSFPNVNIVKEDIEDIFGDYVQNTFFGAAEAEAELDAEIEAASIKWKMSRMSISTRCALRLAAYEMTKTDLPAKIAINEALEIVKTYDDESAPAFVNGILNKIAREHGLITPPAAE